MSSLRLEAVLPDAGKPRAGNQAKVFAAEVPFGTTKLPVIAIIEEFSTQMHIDIFGYLPKLWQTQISVIDARAMEDGPIGSLSLTISSVEFHGSLQF